MAIFFTERELNDLEEMYDALPAPKPSREDFYTYVFEQPGRVQTVKGQDLTIAAKRAVGAAEARDRRKHYRR